MKRIVAALMLSAMCCWLWVVPRAQAAVTYVYFEDFDEQNTGSGAGHPEDYSFYGSGLEDWGVSSLNSYSSSNSAYLSLNNATTVWGSGMYTPVGGVNMSSGVLSVAIMRTAGTAGGVAFKVRDNEGNEYRTENVDLYYATTGWTIFTQSIYDLTFRDAGSGDLNVSNITQIGMVVYKAGSDTINYYFDDFSATGQTVPEPQIIGLILAGALLVGMIRWARLDRKKDTS